MADTFHVQGDHVYFNGYHVAVLASQVPATIREAVEEALHAYDPDAGDAAAKELTEMEDARAYLEREAIELRSRVESLESLLRARTP